MGNYVLKHIAGDKETVYKFHRNLHMKANSYVTVSEYGLNLAIDHFKTQHY